MTVQTDFLDTFRGDKVKLQIENGAGQIRETEAKIVSTSHKEPERINGLPMKGYKSAILEVENDDGQAEIRWLHMTREVGEEKEINFGEYEIQAEEDFSNTPVIDQREKKKLGEVVGLEVIE